MKYYDCEIELTLNEPIDVQGHPFIRIIRVPTCWITTTQLEQVLLAYQECGRYSEIIVTNIKEKKLW